MSVLTNYLYIKALEVLDCTVVTALFATNASFVYLLSWVVLRQQFVGLRIVALILSTTGISLLAYMQSHHKVLVSVVFAASSAAGTAVYKVMFKKFMGEVNFLEVSIFFSVSYTVINFRLKCYKKKSYRAGDWDHESADPLANRPDSAFQSAGDHLLGLRALDPTLFGGSTVIRLETQFLMMR